MDTFDQQHDDNPNDTRTVFWPAQPVNATTRYSALYNNPGGEFGYWVNGSILDDGPIYFTPDFGDIQGETHSFADQMPGGVNNVEFFNGASIYYNGGWHNFAGGVLDDGFGDLRVSDSDLWIYDPACAD